ncbi:hypothetical protein RN22_09025 [Grimontia sp. AD028]|uniref:hypothetical protein n=1 Tax=Grimontia sp. AD028 TaxID=1581149 RepID=UPI00061B1E68|nr:hypothetical protein [Grimontia sp. AD028]KKD60873.1 hypothetical protein RN22_09025 [Grimontia sp. AD028]
MEFSRTIKLSNHEKIVGNVELSCSLIDNIATIHYTDSNSVSGKAAGPSFFYALAEIRESYKHNNIFLLCFGSKRNVFPGGLTSESSFGELAYEFNENEKDPIVVNIFDSIDLSELPLIGDLKEQKEKRRESIRGQR